MGQINNYVAGQLSQITLDDGSKILISIAPYETKVFQLGWFGIPKRELYTFDQTSLEHIGSQYRSDVLKFISAMIQALPNPDAVSEMCKSLERISAMKAQVAQE